MHCLHDKCWYPSSWHVRCDTSRPTYANERTAQDMHMTFENQETKLTCRNHHLVRFLHWSIPQMRCTCDRHPTELHVANTWLKGRGADYTWPQVLQWLNSTENHGTYKFEKVYLHLWITLASYEDCINLQHAKDSVGKLNYSDDHSLTRIHSTGIWISMADISFTCFLLSLNCQLPVQVFCQPYITIQTASSRFQCISIRCQLKSHSVTVLSSSQYPIHPNLTKQSLSPTKEATKMQPQWRREKRNWISLMMICWQNPKLWRSSWNIM